MDLCYPYALSAAGFGSPNSPRMVWPLGQVHNAPNAPADSNPLTRGVAELRADSLAASAVSKDNTECPVCELNAFAKTLF